MITVPIAVPEDRVDDLYEAVAKILKDDEDDTGAKKQQVPWTPELAAAALADLREFERGLVTRLACARGQRIPLSEFAAAFGMPETAALEQDFPRLTEFCARKATQTTELRHPVVAGGDDGAWYWMAELDALFFRMALFPSPADQGS